MDVLLQGAGCALIYTNTDTPLPSSTLHHMEGALVNRAREHQAEACRGLRCSKEQDRAGGKTSFISIQASLFFFCSPFLFMQRVFLLTKLSTVPYVLRHSFCSTHPLFFLDIKTFFAGQTTSSFDRFLHAATSALISLHRPIVVP